MHVVDLSRSWSSPDGPCLCSELHLLDYADGKNIVDLVNITHDIRIF